MLLDQLSKVTLAKGKKPWYEIFPYHVCSSFQFRVRPRRATLLLPRTNKDGSWLPSSLPLSLTAKQRHAAPYCSLTQEMIEEYTHSAENLLYHLLFSSPRQHGIQANTGPDAGDEDSGRSRRPGHRLHADHA